MTRALLAWIGSNDLKATLENAESIGPIARVVTQRPFDKVVLLNNWKKEEAAAFCAWLKPQTKSEIVLRHEKLTSPTHYADIYRAATTVVEDLLTEDASTELTFHLSPGTGAMGSIWILMSPKYGAELVQASREAPYVQTADVPFDIAAEFIPAMLGRRAEEQARAAGALQEAKFGDILHRSEVMVRLIKRARQAAPFPDAVLIEGPSGSGKELLAQAIHLESLHNRAFQVINCGAIPETLVEATFFGHAKGTFTGATADRRGAFEEANNGTLFLDEIGELPLQGQAKLLRALQQKEIRPVGGDRTIKVNVRVIAATNRDLLKEVSAGRFREDLYYRLAVLVLRTPSLRERGDVGYLRDALVERLNAQRQPEQRRELSAGAKRALQNHSWPGNVRELEAVLSRLFIWSATRVIEEVDVNDAIVSIPQTQTQILDRPLAIDLNAVIQEVASHYLERALQQSRGVPAHAYKLVGFNNAKTFTNWCEKYTVEVK